MCGRYAVRVEARRAAAELRATVTFGEIPARYNVAPTSSAPIAIERAYPDGLDRRIGLARFGLVPAASEGPKAVGARYINLRSETVAFQKAFAETVSLRRCLVIADGFYEWKREGAARQPYYIHAADGSLLTFAGVFEVWKGANEDLASFAILTTKPSALIAPIHDRMPLIVSPPLRDLWLSPAQTDGRRALAAVRAAEPVMLEAYRISARVGRVSENDPSLIEPIDDERLRG